MRELLLRLRVPLLFSGLIIAAVVSMLSDHDQQREGDRELPWWSAAVFELAVPVQKMMATPLDGLRDVWARYLALVDVGADNHSLRERIAELEEENLQYREALVASGNLQSIAEMRDEFDTPMLPTEVVGRDVSPWFRSVLLDRGRRHGVRSGMPVITDRGVAGLVTATSPGASKTMLLLDRQSALDGIIQRSRARGIVRGQGTGRLEFEFVIRGDDVRVGDTVISSGLGGVYPKGLRVGEVVSVTGPGPDLLHRAELKPVVDFGRLEQVFIVLRRAPTMDLLYGADGDGDETLPADPAPPPSS